MNAFRNTVAAVSLLLTSLIAQTSGAQQVDLMLDEHYNSRLDSIIKNSMGKPGRTKINGIFEKSKSHSPTFFDDNNNSYSITVYEAFSNKQNPVQPCRKGELTAQIDNKKYLIKVIGCRNDQGVWFIGRSINKNSNEDLEKDLQPRHPQKNTPIDAMDELIID